MDYLKNAVSNNGNNHETTKGTGHYLYIYIY